MYKENKRESVFKKIGGVVHVIGKAKMVGVRVWIMTLQVVQAKKATQPADEETCESDVVGLEIHATDLVAH